MVKQLIGAMILTSCAFGMNAQMDQPLPLNPKVKAGVLPNGLSYYILHNEEPKERANFYIAQKVGSTLEQPDQLGLAHFLEHMAFNGTTNYPGKTMLNYLQSKGIRFGADINAYTSFDETVYNINNVPTTDKNLMDSVLLVLHDWSGDILLEDSEIEAERGVIQEEWRSRNNASNRMWTAILPEIYEEYQYRQMPIGTMDVVMNFKPEVLRAYYHKWYRPDQQGIVIVGDFDADEMEKKVIDLFSTIEMPANAAERTYPEVSDNETPIYVSFTDPELSSPMTRISYKSDKLPFEQRNTILGYINELMENIITGLIDNRLEEFALSPECEYSQAGVYFGNFYVSKTKDSFNIIVIPKNGKTQEATAQAMAIVARACKTGFTESELQRVTDNLLSELEQQYNERDKTNNGALANEIIRHFIDNEPSMGIEQDYMMVKQFLPMLPLEAVNAAATEILTPTNMVVVTSEPEAEGFTVVAEDVLLATVGNAMNAEYEPYVDEIITEPLIAQLPKPGKITATSQNATLGTTTYTLSNGATVVIKPTDFSADEVILTAYRNGGKQIYPASEAPNVLLISDAFEASKFGPFDTKTLKKYLAGKKASVEFDVNNYTDVLKGYSTVKDLPTMMELVYTSFTNINSDQETFDVNMQAARNMLANMENNPSYIFSKQLVKTEYPNNPLMGSPTVETIDQANYPHMLDMIKDVLGNAAEYTFIFTGNVDDATIRPLLEQYIATIPGSKVVAPAIVSPLNMVTGQVENQWKQKMQAPATHVYNIYSDTNLPYNAENDIMVDLMGDVLSNIFTETLREEEGGTYSPSVGAYYNPNNGTWNLIYYFITNADQQAKLMERANAEFMNLLQNGTDQTNFNKVKEAAVKQYEINSKKNRFWDNKLLTQLRFPNVPIIDGYEAVLQGVTLDQFNNFLKKVYNGNNRIQVVMEGVAE